MTTIKATWVITWQDNGTMYWRSGVGWTYALGLDVRTFATRTEAEATYRKTVGPMSRNHKAVKLTEEQAALVRGQVSPPDSPVEPEVEVEAELLPAVVVTELDDEPEVLPSGDLPELAAEANDWHAQAMAHLRSAAICAWHAGRALQAAKAQCAHGEWKPWVEANFDGSYRTAAVYMQVASNVQSAALLEPGESINSALAAINRRSRPGGPDREREQEPSRDKPVVPKLTKAHRSYLLKELDRLREFLGSEEEYLVECHVLSEVESEVRDIRTWIEILTEAAVLIAEAEVKR